MISVEIVNNIYIVKFITHRLTAENVPAFRHHFIASVPRNAVCVMDCSALMNVDSAGLGALIHCFSRAVAPGNVVFCALSIPVRNLMELTGLTSFLPIIPGRTIPLKSL